MPRLLLAHPDATAVRRMKRALEDWRHQVVATTDPTQVITLALRQAPDCVLVGHSTPDETSACARELRELLRTRVIALIARSEPDVVARLASAGVSHFLHPRARRMVTKRTLRRALGDAQWERRIRARPTLRLGSFTFGQLSGIWNINGRMGCLTKIETALLSELARTPGEMVTYHRLIRAAWPREHGLAVPRDRLRVRICLLRRKPRGWDPNAPTILLSPRNGYRLVPDGEVRVLRRTE